MKVVVDTNVPIAANGRNTHASEACQYRCITFLEERVNSTAQNCTLLDSGGEIMAEYRAYLNFVGQPGVGDYFYKHLHNYMYDEEKVQLVDISPTDDESRGYLQLPQNNVDASDRKFLAVAVAAPGAVANATDSDWHEQRDFIAGQKVHVIELCRDDCA